MIGVANIEKTRICSDDLSTIENYDQAILDTEHLWELHHRLETHDENGAKRDKNILSDELKERGLYYNRPSSELIFLIKEEHDRLHMKGNKHALGKNIGNKHAYGNILSEETRYKMSCSRMGNQNNGKTEIRCIETGEILRTREWIAKGFRNAYMVAHGNQNTCKGYHFELVTP